MHELAEKIEAIKQDLKAGHVRNMVLYYDSQGLTSIVCECGNVHPVGRYVPKPEVSDGGGI